MNADSETIETYDRDPAFFDRRFSSLPPRFRDILIAGDSYTGDSSKLTAVELGCGNGRDAEAIASTVDRYIGIDTSEGLLKLARERFSDGEFVCSSALDITYPDAVDYIYAFASLVHVPVEELPQVLAKVAEALVEGGVFYASFRESDEYRVEDEEGEVGSRRYYYYSLPLILRLAGDALELVNHYSLGALGSTWLNVCFRKVEDRV